MSPTEPQVIRLACELQGWSDSHRAAGRRIALVPTMGALHEGHLSLVRTGQRVADRVVVSIFVNPTQFGPGEDFDSYPRDLDRDLVRLRGVGADVVFLPSTREMYPEGEATRVEVSRLTEGLCGRQRPGHFAGVTTVVSKLFLAAKPHYAIFGQKDWQQLQVVRRLVQDLLFDVEIVAAPTVREPDGLAMSSRNVYLSHEARRQACALNSALLEAREALRSGELDVQRLIEAARRRIEKEPLARVEYVEIRDAETLESLESAGRVQRRAVLALAVDVDGTRLIDNTVLEVD